MIYIFFAMQPALRYQAKNLATVDNGAWFAYLV